MRILITFLLIATYLASVHAQSPGNALNFDGINDRVSAGLPAPFTSIATNDFSIEVWFNPLGSSFSRIVFAQNNSNNFANISFATDNTIYFYVVANGQNTSIQSDTALTLGVWTHITATWDAALSETRLYFNGIEQPVTGGGTSTDSGTSILSFGARPDGNQFLNAEMDEVRIWDVVRTECDIRTWMNTPMTGSEAGLVGYYQFNEGTAGGSNAGVTTLPDLTSNMNDGNITGFVLNGTVSNWIASGALLNQSMPTQVVDISVSNLGTSIASNQSGASYQWLDCDMNFATIPGATQQSLTPVQAGNYAVEVSYNGCVDTSACEMVVVSGIDALQNEHNVTVRAVGEGTYQLNLPYLLKNGQASVIDAIGRVVHQFPLRSETIIFPFEAKPIGVYTLLLQGERGTVAVRLPIN